MYRKRSINLTNSISRQSYRYLTGKKTFYDSQSGKHMVIPGSSGKFALNSNILLHYKVAPSIIIARDILIMIIIITVSTIIYIVLL
jgi:hypothetical protein